MSQLSKGKRFEDKTMEEFFDFEEASSQSHSTPAPGLIPMPSIPPQHAITELSPSAAFSSETTNTSHIDVASSALKLAPAHGSRDCRDKKKESEVPPHFEFVTLRELDLTQSIVPYNSFGPSQEDVATCQSDSSLGRSHSLHFQSQALQDQTSMVDNFAAAPIDAAPIPLGPERPQSFITPPQGKRKRSPPPGGFLIPDFLGCSPWPSRCRTEQAQTERDEVAAAGGSCLLCTFRRKKCSGKRPCHNCSMFWAKRLAQTTIPQWTCDIYDKFSDLELFNFRLDKMPPGQEGDLNDTHRQSMATKAFEFVRCCDPTRGIGLVICHGYLPDSLKASFWSCFVPLRAAQWKNALSYFDPDLENYLGDAEWLCRPLIREVFRNCDRLFAARHRAVAVRLLGAINREVDSISIFATSDMVKHIKKMAVSRLKILCPPLLDVRERQRWDVQTTENGSAAILSLEDETAALLSREELSVFANTVQLSDDLHEIFIEKKVMSKTDTMLYTCSLRVSPRVLSGSCLEEPRQAACYCCYVWETIKHDISNFFQITAESIASLLHSEAETRFPMWQIDGTRVKYETLSNILSRFFTPPLHIHFFRKAMTFTPEFIFSWLPMMYKHAKIQLDDGQRRRHAATYRHLVLLSLLVQACSLVDRFRQQGRSISGNRPFEQWLFKRRDANPFETFSEATAILMDIHRTILERELGVTLPKLYEW